MGKVKVGHSIPYYCSLELLFSDKYMISKHFPSTFMLGHGPSRRNHQDQDRVLRLRSGAAPLDGLAVRVVFEQLTLNTLGLVGSDTC